RGVPPQDSSRARRPRRQPGRLPHYCPVPVHGPNARKVWRGGPFHEPENARLDSEGLTRFRFMVPMHAEKKRKGALHEPNALGKGRTRGIFVGRAIQKTKRSVGATHSSWSLPLAEPPRSHILNQPFIFTGLWKRSPMLHWVHWERIFTAHSRTRFSTSATNSAEPIRSTSRARRRGPRQALSPTRHQPTQACCSANFSAAAATTRAGRSRRPRLFIPSGAIWAGNITSLCCANPPT